MAAKRNLLHALALCIERRRRRRGRRQRTTWVKPWIKERPAKGAYQNLVQQLMEQENTDDFQSFVRMDVSAYNELLQLVKSSITKKNTTWRQAICAEERLAITLRFLATGETFKSLSFLYRVGERTISGIVLETCDAIYQALQSTYVKMPSTQDEWKQVSKLFSERWNFPNCIGALDGKHIRIRPPGNSGSTFFNYKHTFSVVLLGLVDANYKFLYVDVGTNGRVSDGGVFSQSSLYSALNSQHLGIPEPVPIITNDNPIPYCIVADEAFPLRNDLMKPYSRRNMTQEERIYNYRLSRARRVVENAFGILANRFRVLLTTIALEPEKVTKIVLCTCALHNFLSEHKTASDVYVPAGYMDSENPVSHRITPGTWRTTNQTLQEEAVGRTTNCSISAKAQRDSLKNYFNSPAGRVEWQEKILQQ